MKTLERGKEMTRKILSCFFAIVFCLLCFAGCSKAEDGAPDGMYSVTRKGDPFTLYVPGDWSDNRDSGISSAYVMSDAAFVSARCYTLNTEDLETYVENVKKQYSSIYADYEETAYSTKESLAKKNAIKYQFEFKRAAGENNVKMTVTQYYALNDEGKVILLSFYCVAGRYKSYETTIAQIKTEFVLRKPEKADNTVVDEDAPKGMKKASFEGGEYVFYVPNSWTTDLSDKMTAATSADGKTNVSVTCFLTGYEMTVDEYFSLCEKQYEKELGDPDTYKRLSEQELHINTVTDDADEKNAKTFVFEVSRAGIKYKMSQTVLYYNGMFYTITYTSFGDSYDANLADLEKMLKNCSFK